MRGRHGPVPSSRARPDHPLQLSAVTNGAPIADRPPPLVPSDLTNAVAVGRLLSYHGIWLTKSLGQHLLVDRVILDRIVASADLHAEMEVLEIGPGVGVLTAELVKHVRRVVAVEIDPKMARILRTTVPDRALEVVESDAMMVDTADLFGGRPYAVVANLPYNVATAIIRRLLALPAPVRPVRMVVMIQREVANRMAALPGDLTALGVEIQVAASTKVLFEVPPTAFFPAPEVTSAVLCLRPYDEPVVPLVPTARRFGQLVRAGFAHRRKQLHNALGTLGVGTARIDAALEAAGIARLRRAETLTLAEWSALSLAIWGAGGSHPDDDTHPDNGDSEALRIDTADGRDGSDGSPLGAPETGQ
jgi:16S rRNA (adenine1518-N6/adenine1519-N6)-dimethyltransferase